MLANKRMQMTLTCWAVLLLAVTSGFAADPQDGVVAKWAQQFQPSALPIEEQRAQLEWFRTVSAPFRGESIRTAAEQLPVHAFERDVLAKAFEELTGIHVQHDNIPEADVVRNLTEQMITGSVLYKLSI